MQNSKLIVAILVMIVMGPCASKSLDGLHSLYHNLDLTELSYEEEGEEDKEGEKECEREIEEENEREMLSNSILSHKIQFADKQNILFCLNERIFVNLSIDVLTPPPELI